MNIPRTRRYPYRPIRRAWTPPNSVTYARGGIVTPRGWFIVGNSGPETITLPAGVRIVAAKENR